MASPARPGKRSAGGAQPFALLAYGDTEPIDEWPLALEDPLPRFLDREPGGTVYLRDLHAATGTRRPLDLAMIAADEFGVAVTGKGPGRDALVSALLHFAEGQEFALCGPAGLFLKLAPGSVKGGFAIQVLTLGDGPRAEIFVCPEGAARVNQEDLQPLLAPSIH